MFMYFLFSCYGDHLYLHSFPTRRSSDLVIAVAMWLCGLSCITSMSRMWFAFARDGGMPGYALKQTTFGSYWRSEEHTSELQSHVNLVCRLLLEKKNKI